MLFLWFWFNSWLLKGNRRAALLLTAEILAYHVIIRIIWGVITNHLPDSFFHPEKKIYCSYGWEKNIHKLLHVKKWKEHVPVFDIHQWDIRERGIDSVIAASCRAELDHATNILLGYVVLLPVFFLQRWAISAWLVAAIGASLFDGVFVTIQRFNRPRLMRLREI